MNDKKTTVDTAKDNAVRSEKAAYFRPELRIYGSVGKLTLGSGGTGADGGPVGMTMVPSDRRVKEKIVRIGEHALGIGLYAFFYKPEHRDAWGHGVQIGVMADEVETALPEAVSIHPAGFKMVNYSMLEMSRVLH